ncbi:MAG: hypothetical protein M1816_002641 [Peltula sp. TS41687]|nr:MAG: hypothetical protein M1816_002641 [Peltula sp. TS41687]
MTPSSFTNHLGAFSPLPTAPRSVGQSPAHLSKKSPANAATLQGIGSSASNPGSGGLTYDSPTAAALGLNLHLNLPGLVEGVTNSNVRGDEEERRRRIESILARLKTRPGRVSQEGVERLAKMTGFECLWQDDGLDGASRTLSIAGSGVLIDVDFRRDLVARVNLSFPTSSEALSNVAERAARILQRDLTVKGSATNASLVPFARHLDRLARLDKLSSLSAPQLNCYEAIWGIYISLRRIFDRESKVNGDMDEKRGEREVMCKHSGRPKMHEGRRLGMSLEYWMERRLVGREETEDDDEESESRTTWALIIECEASAAELYPPLRVSQDWVSDGVVKPKEEHPQDDLFDESPDDSSSMIDWLEPPPTYLTYDTANPATNAMGTTSQQAQPNVRFVAILDPPVAVPLHAAYEIYNMVGVQIPQEPLPLPIYDELLLEKKVQSRTQTQTQGGIQKAIINRDVLVPSAGGDDDDDEEEDRIQKHQYNIYVQKSYYGRLIEEIPFSHPRQLVEILPILRQYALLSTLIPTDSTRLSATASQAIPTTAAAPPPPPTEADLASFLSDSNPPLPNNRNKNNDISHHPPTTTTTQIDLSLSTHQSPSPPRMTIIFPTHVRTEPDNNNNNNNNNNSGGLATLVVEIHPNGVLRLSTESSELDEVLLQDSTAARQQQQQQLDEEMLDVDTTTQDIKNEQDSMDHRRRSILERALDVTEDVGIWVEWILRRTGRW